MSSYVRSLEKKGLIQPPKWLRSNNQHLEVIMGSMAYGVSSDSSDLDLYGFCLPPLDDIFPHMRGEIPGFGRQKGQFAQYQQHHIMDKSARGGKDQEYDITIYSIVKYFKLVMENNPNLIDSLFVPLTCITHSTKIGNMVRERRKSFLHKGAWHKFKGYAYSQLYKIFIKNPEGKRKEIVEKYGFDVKFGYHTVRLIQEVEMILTEGDLDLQRNNEVLKAIRRGERTAKWIKEFFNDKEKQLEEVYNKSKLPYKPDEEKIKQLLIDCIEEHYGSISTVMNAGLEVQSPAVQALKEIQEILDKNEKLVQ